MARHRFTEKDLLADSTLRDFRTLDHALSHIERTGTAAGFHTLVDLGCGYGGVTSYVADRLTVEEAHGIDHDAKRLEVAQNRGVTPHRLDLEHDRYPFDDGSVDVILSFGTFEHLVWYDSVLSETARILRDDGYFLIAKPNLGSYINRVALLCGYQPRNVEVSQRMPAGTMRHHWQKPLGHVHSATLRAMRELLDHHRFSVERTYGFSPDFGGRIIRLLDRPLSFFPSISRRYIIVARRHKR